MTNDLNSAVNFASQLAQTITNTFSALFNGPNAINFNALTGGGGGGSGPAAILGGVGNFAQTAINTKLNLLNGLLSPFTGGRPLLGGGSSGGGSNPLAALFNLPQSSSSSGGYSSSASEPNFRITIAASTPAPVKDDNSASASNTSPNRSARFFQPYATKASRPDEVNSSGNFLASLGRGLFGGMLDHINANANANRNRNLARGPDSTTNTYLAQILPNLNTKARMSANSENNDEATRKQIEQSLISSLLQSAFTTKN